MPAERLQKVLAAAGYGSRRACEMLILDGRVQVNGHTPRELPVLVDPATDRVLVDGKAIQRERMVYLLLHKPRGVLCTNNDPDGRPRVVDLLKGVRERVYPVGRLDADSSGLLLMTNDGELAERLMHARYGVPRTYRADVEGGVAEESLEKLREGIWLPEGRTQPAHAKIIHRQRDKTVLEITLREGRNREVRHVLARLGHKVRRLLRIALGPLQLRGLPVGAFRPLRSDELETLRRNAARAASGAVPPRKTARRVKAKPLARRVR